MEALDRDVRWQGRRPQPLLIRLTHWLNVPLLLLMAGSGLQIFAAYPALGPRGALYGWYPWQGMPPPAWVQFGGWLAGALLWHFAAMWVLAINGLIYLALGLVTGRFRRKLWPIRPTEVVADVKAALTFKLAHDDLAVYNAVQRLLYVGVSILSAAFPGIIVYVVLWIIMPKPEETRS